MKRKSITVTLTKTVQASQFEPLIVTISETAEMGEGDKVSDVREKLYESTSKGLHKVMGEELTRWKRKSKD